MRILYLDIDALRADHLGCYGYHRATSPAIDRIAAEGVRLDRCLASDTPCLPSRSALYTGRCGTRTGVVANSGGAADPAPEGGTRGFKSALGRDAFPARLARAGLHTCAISPFGERHSAFWWYAGFREIHNTGRDGMESAEEIQPLARDWLERRGASDDWFLQVHYWDVHTPYRTPAAFGDPFAGEPLPPWPDEAARRRMWEGAGPQCARERGCPEGTDDHRGRYPQQPFAISDQGELRRLIDGYDRAIRYVDGMIAELLAILERQGVLRDTAIIVGSDHGECLGEFNIWGCHQTADWITSRIPCLFRWPGVTGPLAGRGLGAYRYHLDWAATVLDLLGQPVPESWDGRSFAAELRAGADGPGRDHLVSTHGQGSCQRCVLFRRAGRELLLIRSWHDGWRDLPEFQLFDIAADPQQQRDLALSEPAAVAQGRDLLDAWLADHLPASGDPLAVVLAEGGPSHGRGWFPRYLDRLRATGRSALAERIAARHPGSRG